jgi:hypothetical protein
VAACNFLDKPAQGVQHVGDRLSWARLRKESDEIDRIPLMQGNADFRFALKAADAGAMAGTWIDNDNRRLGRVETILDAVVAKAGDAEQRIVCRLFEPASIDNELVFEVKERRFASTIMGQQIIGTLAQRVDEEYPALPDVTLISQDIS